MKNSSLIKVLPGVLVSVALTTYIVYKVDKQNLLTALSMFDVSYVIPIIIFVLLNYMVSAIIWKEILVHKNSDHDSVTVNFIEKLIGGFVLSLFIILSLTGFLKFWVFLLLIWFIMSFYLGIIIAKSFSKRNRFFKKIYNTICTYKGKNVVLIKVIALTLFIQILSLVTQYVIFFAFGVKIGYFIALFVFPLITLLTFLIPSVNGIGVQDVLYITLFSWVGIPYEISLVASVLYHLFRWGVGLIGRVLYATGKSD